MERLVDGAPRSFGRYELRGRLGGGGFATVYRAYDPALQREVALKALHRHLARDVATRDRFLREGRALARLRHRNVVIVHDAGEAEGTVFLAMELVEGQPVASLIARHGRLGIGMTAEIISGVAEGIGELHAHGLIHRDVTPANIILETATGRAVLLDLGIARDLAAISAATEAAFGTPGYMAPEQVMEGGVVSQATDVYGLAASAYAMLAGRPPFGGTVQAVVQAVAHQQPPALGHRRPDLPPGVTAVVARGLAKNPEERPRTPEAFAAALARAAGDTAWSHPAPTAASLHDALPPVGEPVVSMPPAAFAGADDVMGMTAVVTRRAELSATAAVPPRRGAVARSRPRRRGGAVRVVLGLAAALVAAATGAATAWAVSGHPGPPPARTAVPATRTATVTATATATPTPTPRPAVTPSPTPTAPATVTRTATRVANAPSIADTPPRATPTRTATPPGR